MTEVVVAHIFDVHDFPAADTLGDPLDFENFVDDVALSEGALLMLVLVSLLLLVEDFPLNGSPSLFDFFLLPFAFFFLLAIERIDQFFTLG